MHEDATILVMADVESTFLQRVSIACYAERCISYDRFCLTDRLTVRALRTARLTYSTYAVAFGAGYTRDWMSMAFTVGDKTEANELNFQSIWGVYEFSPSHKKLSASEHEIMNECLWAA